MKDYIVKNWFLISVIIILICFCFAKCSNDKIQKHDTPGYKTVTTKKEAVQTLQVPETIVKKFTEIKTVTRYVDKIKIDTIKVHYNDSIPCVFERTGELKTPEYTFTYKSNQNGFNVNNMQLHDSLLIVTGTKRKWFLGREINTIDISHTNKYILSDQVQHIEVVKKKPFYDTTLFKIAIGFGIGVAVSK